MKTNLELIREKVIEANRERFGVENKDWEESFYESDWHPDTIQYTPKEKEWVEEMGYFLPRHMNIYDWNLPYIDYILLSIRRKFTNTIRLADVLVTIDSNFAKNPYQIGGLGVAMNGMFFKNEVPLTQWNLREDDLSKQSPETLQFLAELLK